jgi:hypothetical protein
VILLGYFFILLRKNSNGSSKWGHRCTYCHIENPDLLEIEEIKPWVCRGCKREISLFGLESKFKYKIWKFQNFLISNRFEKLSNSILYSVIAFNLTVILIFLFTGLSLNVLMVVVNIIYWQSQVWRLRLLYKKTL